MQVLSYYDDHGWSEPIDSSLDSSDTLVFAFGASRFGASPLPLHQLRHALPQSRLLGCSTAGEIHGTKVRDDSLVAAVLRFEHSQVRTAEATVHDASDSYRAGKELGHTLLDRELRAVVLLSDGLHVNGSELVRGINAVIGDRAIITGGLAADGSDFRKTWVMHNAEPQSGIVAAVGLYGDRVRVGHGSKGGWDIFGPERIVTRSAGNILYELDGKPALQLYKEYLGERAIGLPATALLFPLAVRATRDADKKLVRTVLAVDELQQSMTFAGDIPQGAFAQLMRANFDRLVQGASEAASMTLRGSDALGSRLSIAISCVGRRLVLGERIEEETEAAFDALTGDVRQIGFYSYGEISPYAGGTCDLHNQTMTLTTLGEA
ncbi:MAG TPA: FIST N-terminal domain-containing protein [Gemmatimonadaceae bacterium]